MSRQEISSQRGPVEQAQQAIVEYLNIGTRVQVFASYDFQRLLTGLGNYMKASQMEEGVEKEKSLSYARHVIDRTDRSIEGQSKNNPYYKEAIADLTGLTEMLIEAKKGQPVASDKVNDVVLSSLQDVSTMIIARWAPDASPIPGQEVKNPTLLFRKEYNLPLPHQRKSQI